MGFHDSRLIKKTRKPHTCGFCAETIEKGESVVHHSGRGDGGFYSYHLCGWCEKWMNELMRRSGDECFDTGELYRYVLEGGTSDRDCGACGSDNHEIGYSTGNNAVTVTCGDCGAVRTFALTRFPGLEMEEEDEQN